MIGSNSVLLVAASFIFVVYVSSISTSIAGGDSGEIVAEGCHLGTAHPPGYPLITMIIYGVANWFKFGTVAYRVNVFCALCTTTASLLIGFMVQRLFPTFKSSAGSVAAMGLFAFSPLIWQYAITSEVFPLNTVLAALILYLVVLFSQTSNISFAYIGALMCGLAFTNQHTILLYEVPLVLWMLFLLRVHIYHNPTVLVKLSASYLTGLLPYGYLPLAAHLNPKQGSWGQVTTLSGFVHHILRRDYGTFQLFSGAEGKSAEGFVERCVAFLRDFSNAQTGGSTSPQTHSDVGVVAVVLVALGVVVGLTQITFAQRSAGSDKVVPAAKSSASKKSKKNDTPDTTASTATTVTTINNTVLALCPTESSFTPLVLLLTQLFYFAVFHSLSNLPLRDRLLYGVHQRFWMQPNILMFAWLGVGVNGVLYLIIRAVETVVGTKQSEDHKTRTIPVESALSPKKGGNVPNSAKADKNIIIVDKTSTSGGAVRSVFGLLGLAAACAAVYVQLNTWHPYMDTSSTAHFTDYATSILAPLPRGAVLLINYDQQWTSVRYAQVCEGLRPDVTALQLSMMTYSWFQSKRDLYPHLIFPGTYHTYPGSVAQKQHQAFTLKQFLDHNTPHVPIYLGGKLSYSDPQLSREYEMMPEGMVSRFVPVSGSSVGAGAVSSVSGVSVASDVTAHRYVNITHEGWASVSSWLSIRSLPDPVQFPMETWEWTIARDYRDRLADTAAFLLEKAFQVEETDLLPLVEAVYWLESAYLVEQVNATQLRAIRNTHDNKEGGDSDAAKGGLQGVRRLITSTLTDVADHGGSGAVHTPSHLLKNAGLAHVHLVRNTAFTGTRLPLPQRDVLHTHETGLLSWPRADENYKLWASTRFLFFWGEFLAHPDAHLDSQYAAIKSMYETATKSAPKSRPQGGAGGSGANEKNRAKKKSKKAT